MLSITFGNSGTGQVETIKVESAQFTYNTLRDSEDHELAFFSEEGWWLRIQGSVLTRWTDITISEVRHDG